MRNNRPASLEFVARNHPKKQNLLLIGEGNGNLAYATIRTSSYGGVPTVKNKISKDQQHPEPNRCRIVSFIDL